MAAIRHEPAMADAGPGRGCIPVILPVQLTRAKIPVNFLLFTGSLDLLSHKLSFRIRRLTDRSERRLTHRQQTIAAVVYSQVSLLVCAIVSTFSANEANFRKRSQRAKP